MATAAAALFAIPQVAFAAFAIQTGAFVCNDNAACDQDPVTQRITVMPGFGGVPTIPGFSVVIGMSLTNVPGGPLSSVVDTTWNVTIRKQ